MARHPFLRDAAVAAVAFGLTLGVLTHRLHATRSLDALGVTLAVIACFTLVARRRAPLAVFVVTSAASATLTALGYAVGPPFGPTAALFFVANDEHTRVRMRETVTVVLAVFVAHVSAAAVPHNGFPTSPVLFGVVVWGGAWIAGDQLRQRRSRRVELVRDMERERRLAAAEERTRIARDLHDSAAHAINVILVQAGAARLLRERDPTAAHEALSTIEDVARETIGEIDQLVRNLRDPNTDELVAIDPPTGLAGLTTLIDRYRAAGLAIDLRTEGRARALTRGVDQAAFRILQESLTNAARHGSGAANIVIRYGETELELTVSNAISVRANNQPAGGHGILGMRERAALLGGTLNVMHDGGSFRVQARLPYNEGAR